MADWRKLALEAILADGTIDDAEEKFESLFFKAIEQNVLRDGEISAKEADWMRKMLFADGKIDDNEKKFLTRIKKAAKKTSPKFEQLYQECVAR
jgi:hypothetical protein